MSHLPQFLAYRTATRTAVVAAAFSAVVAALLLYDYLDRTMKDPLQTTARDTLKAAQKVQPDNPAITEALRKLDTDSRKEYLREKWFAFSGAALLCGGLIVFLVAAPLGGRIGAKAPLPRRQSQPAIGRPAGPPRRFGRSADCSSCFAPRASAWRCRPGSRRKRRRSRRSRRMLRRT